MNTENSLWNDEITKVGNFIFRTRFILWTKLKQVIIITRFILHEICLEVTCYTSSYREYSTENSLLKY